MATFLEKHMFHVFIISNAVAMYSAIIVVVALIWAQLGDLNLVIAAFQFCVPILGLALTMVSIAFMAGNYLVLRNLNWLVYLVSTIGSFFLITLFILFLSLFITSSASHFGFWLKLRGVTLMKGNKNNLYVCCLDMNYLVLNLQAKVESNEGHQPKLKLVEHIIDFFFF